MEQVDLVYQTLVAWELTLVEKVFHPPLGPGMLIEQRGFGKQGEYVSRSRTGPRTGQHPGPDGSLALEDHHRLERGSTPGFSSLAQ